MEASERRRRRMPLAVVLGWQTRAKRTDRSCHPSLVASPSAQAVQHDRQGARAVIVDLGGPVDRPARLILAHYAIGQKESGGGQLTAA